MTKQTVGSLFSGISPSPQTGYGESNPPKQSYREGGTA
jgi:hypothetical protein